jgi:hypothetical protein
MLTSKELDHERGGRLGICQHPPRRCLLHSHSDVDIHRPGGANHLRGSVSFLTNKQTKKAIIENYSRRRIDRQPQRIDRQPQRIDRQPQRNNPCRGSDHFGTHFLDQLRALLCRSCKAKASRCPRTAAFCMQGAWRIGPITPQLLILPRFSERCGISNPSPIRKRTTAECC